MGRNLKFWIAEQVTEPLEYRQIGDDVDDFDYKETRDAAPYRNGDVMLVNLGSAHDPNIVRARVFCVFTKYLERRGVYTHQYRVQTETKKGIWSKNWRDVWCGDIYRAYYGPDGNPRPEYAHLVTDHD